MNKRIIADVSLLLVAFVWGTTFVIVQNAIDTLPPHSFNAIRFGLASIALFITILLTDKKRLKTIDKKLLMSGSVLGIFLFGGYAFQTVGLLYTTASKAGFITGLNVVLVPIMSIFLLKLFPKWPTLLGVIFATTGLYLLTMIGETTLQIGDLLVFFCAIFFALQIVFTGKYAPNYNFILLAWVQVSVVSILSFIFAIVRESFLSTINIKILMDKDVLIALLITSIFATALAFLAQTAFQRYSTPTRVAIIFAMEPVFAALTSFIVQHERLNSTSLLGGLFIFIGMILAEIPSESFATFFHVKHKKKTA